MEIGLVAGPWGMDADEVVGAVQSAERLGFASFYLGDHFYVGQQLESYDPYILFTLVARETSRIRFGPLVTPVMFRAPWNLGRLAAQIDILSGGRFVLGLGAGWSEAEHTTYGVPYPPLKERFDRLDEAIQVMRAMWAPGPASFQGQYYRLRDAEALPKPGAGRPPILIGGGGEQRTLRLAAKYAQEWSGPGLAPAEFRRKLDVLAGHCEQVGRDPATIRHSMLSMGPIGATEADIDAATKQQMERTPPPEPMSLAEYRAALKARGGIVGGVEEIIDSLGQLSEAGVDEALFVYSPAVPAFLASAILPKVARL
jgi:F420-dependent oxidoreductase-like protein